FEDITECLWWAVVTLTTLGYGDAILISGWEYLVGSICAVMGVLCTGLPIVVIGSEFNTCYSQARSLIKRKQNAGEEQDEEQGHRHYVNHTKENTRDLTTHAGTQEAQTRF
ncbi:hypothetical protein CAPTEDRAFT_124180, partial [Capitella teleta]